MGLFDYVRCKYRYEGIDPEKEYQTKSTDFPYMEKYTITDSGRLIYHEREYFEVPLEARPNYGQYPNDSIMLTCGAVGSRPLRDVELKWHGAFEFGDEKRTWSALFDDGQLLSIKEVA